jgi:hypothetical protein
LGATGKPAGIPVSIPLRNQVAFPAASFAASTRSRLLRGSHRFCYPERVCVGAWTWMSPWLRRRRHSMEQWLGHFPLAQNPARRLQEYLSPSGCLRDVQNNWTPCARIYLAYAFRDSTGVWGVADFKSGSPRRPRPFLKSFYEFPINTPVANTSSPPSTTCMTAENAGVPM